MVALLFSLTPTGAARIALYLAAVVAALGALISLSRLRDASGAEPARGAVEPDA
ncbi:hypothetical protein D3C72_2237880 [compost metagenome]